MVAAFDSTALPTGPQFRNMTGSRFSRLLVTGFAGTRNGVRYWNVTCDCGVSKTAAAANLTTGKIQSCGCLQRESMKARLKDLTGQTFGRLTVTGLNGFRGSWSYWDTRCDCGNTKVAKGALLVQGQTRSCGCLASETTAARNKANIKHGASYTSEYRTWCGMKDRCMNPKNPKFAIYGGRGIKVCDRWLHSFEAFLADMGRKSSADLSLDRYPNGDGNYEPGNCRWATDSQQNSNRRTYTRRRAINPKEPQHGRA